MKDLIKIGLIDDEPLALDRLKAHISGIPGYSVAFAETNPEKGLLLATQELCEILITDIQMGSLNGLLICEKMEEIGIPVMICTAYEEYALPSISVSVSAYLIKPIDFMELKRALSKISQKLDQHNQLRKEMQKEYMLVIDYASFGAIKVFFKDLLFIEQEDNYSYFQTDTDKYKQRSSLSAVEKSIKNPNLIRIHRSYIVNMEKVKKIYPQEVILEDGRSLPLGRKYKSDLFDTYNLQSIP